MHLVEHKQHSIAVEVDIADLEQFEVGRIADLERLSQLECIVGLVHLVEHKQYSIVVVEVDIADLEQFEVGRIVDLEHSPAAERTAGSWRTCTAAAVQPGTRYTAVAEATPSSRQRTASDTAAPERDTSRLASGRCRRTHAGRPRGPTPPAKVAPVVVAAVAHTAAASRRRTSARRRKYQRRTTEPGAEHTAASTGTLAHTTERARAQAPVRRKHTAERHTVAPWRTRT